MTTEPASGSARNPAGRLAAIARLETAAGEVLCWYCWKRAGKYAWELTDAALTRSKAAAENALTDYVARHYAPSEVRLLQIEWRKRPPL